MKDRTNPLWAMFLGIIIGVFLLHNFTNKPAQNLEEFALGEQTSSYFAKDNKAIIHISKLNEQQTGKLLKGWENRGKKKVILVLGNSQTHGINQFKKGEVTYNHLLFNKYKATHDVLCLSIPNGNLQEFLVAFEYFIQKVPVEMLILPIFMDDIREDGVRKYFFSSFYNKDFRIEEEPDGIVAKINNVLIESKEDVKALEETTQEISEKALNQYASKKSDLWRKRSQVRGELFLWLYQFRNSIFGINPQSKRKIIPIRYQLNLGALKHILSKAKINKVKTLVYIPPIRSDVETPYLKSEYKQFKLDVKKLTETNKDAHYASFEAIVPGDFWGMKSSTNTSGEAEYDFMHFQFQGHQLLFQSISKEINHLMK